MSAEVNNLQIRPPEPVNITILQIKNLTGCKGETTNVTAKVEFGDKILGESPKQECSADAPTELNFSVSFLCSFDDQMSLDDITHKPVVVTVLEVITKDNKKNKEEKTNILGQSCIDLFPLMKGSTVILNTLPLCPVTDSIIDRVTSPDHQPQIDVKVAVAEPLLDEAQLQAGNFITISVGSLYSLPESWNSAGAQYTYGVATPVPLTDERELPIFFLNGKLKQAQDKEGSKKQKKWAVPGMAVGNSAFLPDRFLFSDPIENEDGELKGKDDIEHRRISEQEKNRVTWNMERRCFIQPSAVKSLQSSIAKNYFWPVEVLRLVQPSQAKGRKEEERVLSYHGVAYMNLSPLLYPGVTSVKGAFKVVGYSNAAIFEKTKRTYGISDDLERCVVSLLRKFSTSPFQRKTGKDTDKKEMKKMNALKSESALDTDATPPWNIEGQQFSEAKSYIMIEVCLDKPLVKKRTPEALVKRVAELIPPRPLFPKITDRAKKAVEDFHTQVASVAGLILDEFRDLFAKELKEAGPQTNDAIEDRRKMLVYELNSTGKFFAIKEQLKNSVVKIVREKYLRTVDFDNKQDLQTFLSELYVYLIDEMHVSLGKFLALEDQPPVPKPLTDTTQLRHFAQEAEMIQNFDLAAKYYKERIARNKNDADCWFDFGTFNLHINDIAKAEECFKECLSINQKHLNGLLLHGVVCVLLESNEAAETLFEAATCMHPSSILAWTMLGLFYDTVSNEFGAEMAYNEANRLNLAKAQTLAQIAKEEEENRREEERKEKEKFTAEGVASLQESVIKAPQVKPAQELSSHQEEITATESPSIHVTSIFMDAVDWLLEVKAVSFAERALGHELLTCPDGPSIDFHIALAKLYQQKGDYLDAWNSLNLALQIDIKNQDAWSLMGHVKYLTGDMSNARHCYERTLSFITDAKDPHPVYLRLATIYLQEKKYQEAKNTFLMACKRSPSCVSWLGVGIACYRLEELAEAEDALCEANILNNNDPQVWAYLSLLCLKTNRCLQAEQAYKYAIKLNLEEGPLLAEIHGEQARYGFGNPSF